MTETLGAGSRLGHYRILGKLGAGGMGEVYRAEDLKLERQVAIKTLSGWAAADRTAIDRLLREARLASALSHPGIVTVHAIEEADGLPFLVMELVEGETLRARLERGPLDLADLVAIGSEVADALHAAHKAGLIHRDIKSTNILLTPDGRAKVADFGLAKRMPGAGTDPEATAAASLTTTGAVVGTAAYMSPEQSRGEGLDPRTDVFSLGVALYEAATGRLPFEGPTVFSLLHQIALVEPPAPSRVRSGLPRALDHIVLRAMAKNRERRFASMRELAQSLRALLEPDAAASQPGTEDTPAVVPHNLPVPLTSFVGRRDEMEEIARLIEGQRLVTLTGAGGCGKSRLSIQIARNLLESFPHGVWMAELASLSDSSLLPQRVAAAAGIREEPDRPILETLRSALADRVVLLVLDNCEHLTAACAALASALLEAASGTPHSRHEPRASRTSRRDPRPRPAARGSRGHADPHAPRSGTLRVGAALRGACGRVAARVHAGRGERPGGGADLRASGRHSARDRAGGRAHQGPSGGPDPRAPRGPLPAPHGRRRVASRITRRFAPRWTGATTSCPSRSVPCSTG